MFRNSILVRCHQPDLGNIYDLLKQISPQGMTSQKYHPDLDSDSSSAWREFLRSFIPSPILVPRASWEPKYEDQEALDLSQSFLIIFKIFSCSCRNVNDC